MPEYDNTNRGAIWKNEKKDTPTHPDFRGNANIEGVEYWVSAWKRDPDANPKAPALRFSFTLKEPRVDTVTAPSESVQPTDFDDDIPF